MKEISISEMVVVKLIIVLLILIAALWAMKFTLKNAPFRRAIKLKTDRIMPIVEAVVWLGYMLWCIQQLIQNDTWNAIGILIILLLLVVMLSWFVIRDYLAGIVLKSDGSMKLNDWIKVKNIEGKITEMGHRAMIITTDSGETVNVPYSTLSGEISAKPNPSEKLISHTFEIKISRVANSESTITQIRRSILNAPWASVRKSPEIKLLADSREFYHFEISIYSIRIVYFQKIKDYLGKALSAKGLYIEDLDLLPNKSIKL